MVKKKVENVVAKGTKLLYTCMMLLIVGICVLCDRNEYFLKKTFLYSNKVNVPLGMVGVGILFSLCLFTAFLLKKKKVFGRKFKGIMLGLNIFLGCYMLFSTYQYYFKTGWDAEVIITTASMMAHGQYGGEFDFYFSRCDNNIVIALLYSLIIKLGNMLPFGNDYLYLVMFQCAILAYSGFMLYLCVEEFTGKTYAAVGAWGAYVVLMGLSPWAALPYSDVLALLFLVSLLYLYKTGNFPILFGVLVSVGFSIKPTVAILLIAMLLLDFPKAWKRMVAGGVFGIVLVGICIQISPIRINEEARLGVSHYLMLGLNEERDGVFSENDLIFSESFSTNKERDAANWKEAMVRLKDMGLSGLLEHWKDKILVTYNDGSFAWAAEGGFFKELLFSGNEKLRSLYRSVYVPGEEYYIYYLSVSHTVWMGCLGVCVLALIQRIDKKILVLGMTIIGVTLFELLFEPRARHLIIYLPVYLTLMALGFENIRICVRKKVRLFQNVRPLSGFAPL